VRLTGITPSKLDHIYPVCTGGERACPPEDCGGVPGYYLYLLILKDPTHEQHQEMLDWRGTGFDAEAFDLQRVNKRIQGRSRGRRAVSGRAPR